MQRRTVTIFVFAFVVLFVSSSVFGQSAKSPGSEATPIRIGGTIAYQSMG
jgi:hypothetical protein